MKQVKTEIDGQDFYYTAWMDKKPVHIILSTFSLSCKEVKRAIVSLSEDSMTSSAYTDLSAVGIIYNYGMGGADRFDQKLSYYRINLRTRKWKRKIDTHLIMNVAVVNSHILQNKESRNLDRTHRYLFSQIHFQEALINQLEFPNNSEPIPCVAFRKPYCPRDPQRVHGFDDPLIIKRLRNESADLRKSTYGVVKLR